MPYTIGISDSDDESDHSERVLEIYSLVAKKGKIHDVLPLLAHSYFEEPSRPFHIYFRLYSKGLGSIIPAVVVRTGVISSSYRKKNVAGVVADLEEHKERYLRPYDWEKRFEEIRAVYANAIKKITGTDYYLIDGEWRAKAAVLTHNPVYALELESSRDLDEIRTMREQGEMLWFEIPNFRSDVFMEKIKRKVRNRLRDLLLSYEAELFRVDSSFLTMPDMPQTLQESVDGDIELGERAGLSQEMIRSYQREQTPQATRPAPRRRSRGRSAR
jgi:hypothetical protein